MGLLSKTALFVILFIIFLLSIPWIGFAGAIVLDSIIAVGIVYLSGQLRSRRSKDPFRAKVSVDSMSLGRFLGLLLIVAIIAVMFSPSVIGIQRNIGTTTRGTSSPLDTSKDGASQFFNSLRASGYTIVLTNNTNDLDLELERPGRAAYFMIGPDTSLTTPSTSTGFIGAPSPLNLLINRYRDGTLSFLISEGNNTNNVGLLAMFHASISGSAITDPSSDTFQNHMVFTLNATIGSSTTPVLFDVASPILFEPTSNALLGPVPGVTLHPAAQTSSQSFDSLNFTEGPRTVLATAESPNSTARVAIISDSAAFTNYAYNSTIAPTNSTTIGSIEKNFTSKLVDWVTRGDRGVRIIYDNSHFKPQQLTSSATSGLPVGPFAALAVENYIQVTGNIYDDFVRGLGPVLAAFFGILLAYGVYGGLTRWYASEPRGRDDQPVPSVEKSIVAQSRGRQDFVQTFRDKEFYVARMGQLYEALNDLILKELGTTIESLKIDQLASRIGTENAIQSVKQLDRLDTLHEYALRRRRFLFPPVLRWKRTASRSYEEAEAFLNKLGITMTGKGETRSMLEYRLRK